RDNRGAGEEAPDEAGDQEPPLADLRLRPGTNALRAALHRAAAVPRDLAARGRLLHRVPARRRARPALRRTAPRPVPGPRHADRQAPLDAEVPPLFTILAGVLERRRLPGLHPASVLEREPHAVGRRLRDRVRRADRARALAGAGRLERVVGPARRPPPLLRLLGPQGLRGERK